MFISVAANHTANIVSTGNSAVITSVFYTANISTYQTAYIVTSTSYAGCVNNVFYNASSPSICIIIITTIIITNNTAYIICPADDTFVITTVHIAVVCADDTANITAACCTTVGNAKAIHILNIAVVYAYHTAKASTCTPGNICTYCYCAVAEAVGKAAIICANQTTCNGTGTACDNAAGAFNIVNSAAVVINTNNAACIACIAILTSNGYSITKGYNAFNASVVLACNSTSVLAACKCAAVNVNVFNNAASANGAENTGVSHRICITATTIFSCIKSNNTVAAAVKSAGKAIITACANSFITTYAASIDVAHQRVVVSERISVSLLNGF